MPFKWMDISTDNKNKFTMNNTIPKLYWFINSDYPNNKKNKRIGSPSDKSSFFIRLSTTINLSTVGKKTKKG